MNMNNKFIKGLFTGIFTLGLIFSTFVVAFAAGGSGGAGAGAGGTGGGNGGGNTDPISLVGAYLTTISGNVSTTGKDIKGSNDVDVNPTIKLAFDRNVVNSTVWDNNSNAISLADSDGNAIAINVSRIPDEGTDANRDEKQFIFVSPAASLTPGKSYTLTIKNSVTGKDGNTLRQKEAITFTVKMDIPAPMLTINTPEKVSKTNQNKLLVSGKTEPRNVVSINNTEVPVNEEGLFSYEVTLSVGLNKIKITATNDAGKKTETELQVTYNNSEDVTPPVNNGKDEGTTTPTEKGKDEGTITPTEKGTDKGTTTPNGGNKLPDTASTTYNFMYAGMLLSILGVVMIAGPRLRKLVRKG